MRQVALCIAILSAPLTAMALPARYVKIQLRGTNYLSLAEVQAFEGTTNVALGKLATQSSTLSNPCGPSADKAVDGNTNGLFSACTTTHTNLDPQAWWQVDLLASYTIDNIVIWNRSDCCVDRLSNFDLLISLDGLNWTSILYSAGTPPGPFSVSSRAAAPLIYGENQQTGTPAWKITSPAKNHEIEGYADSISVNVGATIRFFVNTNSQTFKLDIYRMGWYGGDGARLMTSVSGIPGQAQPPCPLSQDGRRMIECSWSPLSGSLFGTAWPSPWSAGTLTIPRSWISGIYLAKLTTLQTPAGVENYVIFVVRDDTSRSRILYQTAIATAQAYNHWGGYGLYGDADTGFRSYAASFNRPYDTNPPNNEGYGSGIFLAFEYRMVRWLERNAYDLTYVTSADVDRDSSLLSRHQLFLSVGHDEYWSKNMRDQAEDALRRGVSIGFFGGNPAYWQIRFENGLDGAERRRIVGYKDFWRQDPLYVAGNNSLVTARWRDAILSRPEDALVGQMYGWYTNAASPLSHCFINTASWPFEGTLLRDGDCVFGILGYEYDQVSTPPLCVPSDTSTPPGSSLVVLANSVVPDVPAECGRANATFYRAASGAGVFSAGTTGWSWGLDDSVFDNGHTSMTNYVPSTGRTYTPASVPLQQLSANVLDNLSAGRAAVFDFAQGVPPLQVKYWEPWTLPSTFDGWQDMMMQAVAGDFMGSAYDQVLLLRTASVGGRILIADLSRGAPPATARYTEMYGQSVLFDGWYGKPGDRQLSGDFMGLGRAQVLFINNTSAPGAGRVMIADFSTGGPPATVRYWETWGDPGMVPIDLTESASGVFAGDFMGSGHAQVLFLRNASSGKRVYIYDFSLGPPARLVYREDYGQSSYLDGYYGKQNDRQLVGDFAALGRAQMLFINSLPPGGRVTVADFGGGVPPAVQRYGESWGQYGTLDGWTDPSDRIFAGRFMGSTASQILFLNMTPQGGRILVGDVSSGVPPIAGRYGESWGQSALLDGWHSRPAAVGRFSGASEAQILLLGRW